MLDEPGRDGRGLVVRGKHWLILAPNDEATTLHRSLAYELFHGHPFSATFSNYSGTPQSYVGNYLAKYSGLQAQLPSQINLLTLKPLNTTSLLVRLEHFYQKTEDATVVNINLAKIFNGIQVNTVQEWNLQATEVVQNLSPLNVTSNVILDVRGTIIASRNTSDYFLVAKEPW
uniref:Glycosyl hydrolases family 38 C-terminal domain-containing protein n=1 Tax=Acrobeloides nanus TaxID=290746 RepID=A0A914CIX6_9BILA